jgi:alanine dehydrogenase
LSFVEEIAAEGLSAFQEDSALRRGVYIYEGQCTHPEMAGLFGWDYADIDQRIIG